MEIKSSCCLEELPLLRELFLRERQGTHVHPDIIII